MYRYLSVFAALAVSQMTSAFVPSLKASESDKKTIITISQPIAVEETVLPAGQYVLQLQDSTNRDLVEIFNGEGTRLITTIQAIPVYRLQPASKAELSFYESPAQHPAALHTWFYPGDNIGFEFLQPKHAATADLGQGSN